MLKIFATVALLGILAVVAIGFFLGPIVTQAVNMVGPRVTGTKVELDGAKINILTGGAELSGLFIGNPEGWTGDKAMYLGHLRASVRPMSLLGDHVRVKEVLIDGPEFVYEKKLFGGSNIDALLKQIEANTGGSGAKPAPAAEEAPAGQPLKFAIEYFRIQNAKMTIVAGGAPITVSLPPLTIENLGVAEGGITADQVALAAMKRIFAQMGGAAADAAKQAGAVALEGGKEGAKAAGEALKGGLNRLLGK